MHPPASRAGSPSIDWERPALAAGLAAGAAQIAAMVFFGIAAAPHMPPVGAPAALHAAFYDQHHDTLLVANYLYLLPTPFFLVFLAGLFTFLRRVEAGVLTAAAGSAGVALAMSWRGAIVVATAGQAMAREGLDAASVVAFDAVAQLGLAAVGFPRAVLFGATSLALLRAAVGPRWLHWFGSALAVAALVSTGTLVSPGLFPIAALANLLFGIWLVGLSAALSRSSGRLVLP